MILNRERLSAWQVTTRRPAIPGVVARFEEEIEHRTSDTNPARTSAIGRSKVTQELQDRTLEFEQNVEFTSDEENFYLKFHRWVLVNGEQYAEKTWEEASAPGFSVETNL